MLNRIHFAEGLPDCSGTETKCRYSGKREQVAKVVMKLKAPLKKADSGRYLRTLPIT
jgi:hypothetical protein